MDGWGRMGWRGDGLGLARSRHSLCTAQRMTGFEALPMHLGPVAC